jgi:hypothetical protein
MRKGFSASMQTFVLKGIKLSSCLPAYESLCHEREGNVTVATDNHYEGCSNGKVKLLWFEKGKVMNLKELSLLSKGRLPMHLPGSEGGKWSPNQNPSAAYHYAFGEPLSKEQLDRLVRQVK